MNRAFGLMRLHKAKIILAGLGVGALYIFGVLPESTTIANLDSNVKFIYLGVIGLSFYVFFSFYGFNQQPQFQRNVPVRNLSDPKHLAELKRQYEAPHQGGHLQRRPVQRPTVRTDRNLWDTFNQI